MGRVTGPPEYRDEWTCGSIDGSRESGVEEGGWRYLVRVDTRCELNHFLPEHMRPLGGEQLSTWAKFKRATGIDIRKAPAIAKRKRQSA